MPPTPNHSTAVRRARVTAAAIFAALVLAGCNGKGARDVEKEYRGPTETMSQVVAAINANNSRIPTLWMRHDFRGRIVEPDPARPDKPRTTNFSGDGALLYRAPAELRFNVNGPGIGEIFVVGSNPERYWLWIPFDRVNTLWWGAYEHLGKPCVQDVPVRPDLLLEVLGVSTIDPDFTRFPAPTMTFDGAADAYVFTWIGRVPDRFVAVKQVSYDRATKRPMHVRLFDDNGRVLLRAELSNFQPVEVPDVPREARPLVPYKYELAFPDTGSTMDITVSDAKLTNRLRRIVVPNDRAFAFPTDTGDSKVIQLDEACDD